MFNVDKLNVEQETMINVYIQDYLIHENYPVNLKDKIFELLKDDEGFINIDEPLNKNKSFRNKLLIYSSIADHCKNDLDSLSIDKAWVKLPDNELEYFNDNFYMMINNFPIEVYMQSYTNEIKNKYGSLKRSDLRDVMTKAECIAKFIIKKDPFDIEYVYGEQKKFRAEFKKSLLDKILLQSIWQYHYNLDPNENRAPIGPTRLSSSLEFLKPDTFILTDNKDITGPILETYLGEECEFNQSMIDSYRPYTEIGKFWNMRFDIFEIDYFHTSRKYMVVIYHTKSDKSEYLLCRLTYQEVNGIWSYVWVPVDRFDNAEDAGKAYDKVVGYKYPLFEFNSIPTKKRPLINVSDFAYNVKINQLTAEEFLEMIHNKKNKEIETCVNESDDKIKKIIIRRLFESIHDLSNEETIKELNENPRKVFSVIESLAEDGIDVCDNGIEEDD